jgi:hypothetical protein
MWALREPAGWNSRRVTPTWGLLEGRQRRVRPSASCRVWARFGHKRILQLQVIDSKGIYLVPKGGLEPPHPCEYTDLNRARLPIPPLRQCFVVSSTNGRIRQQYLVSQTPSRVSNASPTNWVPWAEFKPRPSRFWAAPSPPPVGRAAAIEPSLCTPRPL